MLDLDSYLDKAADKIAREVIFNAKRNLAKEGKGNGSLAKSLSYKNKGTRRGLDIVLNMEEHGVYVDRGVRGKGGSKADGTKWKTKKVKNTPFQFKSETANIDAISKWVDKKGIRPKNKNGKTISKKSMVFAIAKSVSHTGIKTTHFFTKALDKALESAEKHIGEEVSKFIESSLKGLK
tara:strand:+ start:79 stop:615 length:537 start_codon:yes stop_codon:yes gene_type:complete